LREVFATLEDRIVIRRSPSDVKNAVKRGAFDIAVVLIDTGEAALRRNLRELRSLNKSLFTIVLGRHNSPGEETAAFDEGADLYFADPLPVESLRRLLAGGNRPVPLSEDSPSALRPATEAEPKDTEKKGESTLHTLRDLSHILSYSLNYEAFTQHFILKLRDHISFSRIGIFIEHSAKQTLIKKIENTHLKCIASIGLPSDLVDCFQLSRSTGIGRALSQEPHILHDQGSRNSATTGQHESSIDKEFAILGCHTAIPISDREGSIGVAVLNGPITGRKYTDDELELLYILMEELGLAIRNSRLHGELAQHGQLIENVLHSMSSGALVCGEDLRVLYANDPAKRFLGIESSDTHREIDFAELPSQLAVPIHRAVEKGQLIEPYFITGPFEDCSFRVSIFPFAQKGELVLPPRPTMIIIEDFTKIEATKKSAVDETKNEVIRLIAERFAHEIRNSLVPLTTHAQLIDKKIAQPEFQASLKKALTTETARIKRFSEQMLYMAQPSKTGSVETRLPDLVEDAFARARCSASAKEAGLRFKDNAKSSTILANPEALTYALEEIFLNSMQAKPGKTEIQVTLEDNNEGILCLRIKDDGPGIPEEILQQATDAFYTTRSTGIGLGLSVAKKIINEHDGFLRLYPRASQKTCDIEIELPLLLTTTV
jgi:nitrogen-specific signal transduction histidine kinase